MNRVANEVYEVLAGTADPAWCQFAADMSKAGPMKSTIDDQNPGNNRRQNMFDSDQSSLADLRAQLNQAFLDEDPHEVARLMKLIQDAGGIGALSGSASDANDADVLDGPTGESGDQGATFNVKEMLGPGMDIGELGEQFAAMAADSTDSAAADVHEIVRLKKRLRTAVKNQDWSEIAKTQMALQDAGSPIATEDFSASTRKSLIKQYIASVKENCPGVSDEDANFAAIAVTIG